ncbi:coniferyl aldehyde dehydrogenase [Aldersonia kunmingensis]|uniref:coniferyl aldehyde dehydrogenase n=1 Tax=Aldersonia kunmingensis TaxID=408066 RepID=UPI00083577EF|nr:coniferyl aldehyde dehydrogenase [Aldersonia kunmingensis]
MSSVEADVAATETGPSDELRRLLEVQREAFLRDQRPSVAVRRNRMDRLVALMLDNTDEFVDALVADFGSKSRTATLFTEILGIMTVIEHTRSNIPKWMRATKPARAARLFGIRAEVAPSPLGVVGIIGPWNFPLHLVVLPAAAAFAAGNRVMIKMSEVTPHTAELLKSLAPKYFDRDELAVVTGDARVAADFSSLPFDHLFFTGSPQVGSLVQRAAAANLVPVTLELGGKNPVVVASGADITRAATRIALGRMVNGGQVCVCPDYVLVPESTVEQFVGAARTALSEAFPTIASNDEYPASVNQANFERVVGLIEDARDRGAQVEAIAPEGETLPDAATRKIAPTIIRGVDDSMLITREETFGPVLSVLTYRDLDEVIGYINRRPSPLVAYWFGPDGKDFRHFVSNTRSGGVARNEFGIHMFPSDAPFGGVGNSGMGAYHGKAGFDTFSHRRSIVGTDLPFPITTSVAVPPFGRGIRRTGEFMLRSNRRKVNRRLGRG